MRAISPGPMPRFDGGAACAEIDGGFWFPDEGGNVDARQAIRICKRCEVLDECLTWALDKAEPFGIWGGLTETQRRKLTGRRRRNVA